MELATSPIPRRTHRSAPAPARADHWGWGSTDRTTDLRVVENPLAGQDPALAREAEEILMILLGDEDFGRLEARFRICNDDAEGFRFICKIEGPAAVDPERASEQWRWWSPLMVSAEDLRTALAEAVEVRRQRLAVRERRASA